MKEKMRKVRYPMLIVWGIFMGAAGTAGVKSSWHVIPGWLIGVIVILGIMVMLTWMISGKNDKSIKTPEKETEKLTSKYNSEISVISKAVEEPVELEFWGKRNGIDQFRVKSIAGRNIVSDHVLLISFDGSEARDVALDAVVTGKEHSEYFGKKLPLAASLAFLQKILTRYQKINLLPLCLFINTVALFNGSKATLRRKCDLLSDYGAGFGITFFKKIMIFQNRVLGRD